MDHTPPLTPRERLERYAAEAEAVGDRSAPWLRALADHTAEMEAQAARHAQDCAVLVERVLAAEAAVRETSKRGWLSRSQVEDIVVPALWNKTMIFASVFWGLAFCGVVAGVHFYDKATIKQNVWMGFDAGGEQCEDQPPGSDPWVKCWQAMYRYRPDPAQVPPTPAAAPASATRAAKGGTATR